MGRTACTVPQCLYKGALYLTVELYLYSPYGSYGLYSASEPVQGSTLPYSRAIPLLPLSAERPAQSLSACTRVNFTLQYSYTSTSPLGRTVCTVPQCLYKSAFYLTVELYLYSAYGPYGLYRASVPVQGCILPYSRAIPIGSASCRERVWT
jgi:hypothetical protein